MEAHNSNMIFDVDETLRKCKSRVNLDTLMRMLIMQVIASEVEGISDNGNGKNTRKRGGGGAKSKKNKKIRTNKGRKPHFR